MGYNISLIDILDLMSGTIHVLNSRDAEDELFFGSKDDFYASSTVYNFLDAHGIDAADLCVDSIQSDPGLSDTVLINVYW